MAMRALLPFLLLLASASSLAVDYSSKSVLLVSGLSSDDDAAFLLRLLEEEGQGRMRRFDVKPISPGEDTVLAVEQEGREDVIRALESAGLSVEVAIPSLAPLLQAERGRALEDCTAEDSTYSGDFTFDAYHDTETMYDYFEYLDRTVSWVNLVSIGESYEGRDMRVLRVCKGGNGECGKRYGMWIDGGIHAREWIAPATAMFLAQELVENDGDHPDLTENMDWYILPVANPDGYAYSREEDRFWRMTRRPNDGFPDCIGADANRNWGYEWGLAGASDDPCNPDQLYHGPFPFSEQEIVNVAEFVNATRDSVSGSIQYYMAIHSYLEAILLPWSYTGDEEISYLDDLFAIAQPAADAMLEVDGVEYAVNTIPNLVGESAGASTDWNIAVGGVKYAYGMELRGGPVPIGVLGFVLPPEEICPCAREVFAFHQSVANAIFEEFGMPPDDDDDSDTDADGDLGGALYTDDPIPASECELEGSTYTGDFAFDDYYSVQDMQDYISYLKANSRMRTEVIGTTFDGNDLLLVKLCQASCGDRHGVWVDAGLHGNEWVAPAAAMYLVQELAMNEKYDYLLDDLDWYILVSANPDGYEKSRTAGNRAWSKNTSPNSGAADDTCYGTDLNRNWAYKWGLERASSDECQDDYRGDYAFSETETLAMANFLLEALGEDSFGHVALYTSLFSGGEKILMPFGYAQDQLAVPSWTDMAERGASAIRAVTGHIYEYGSVFDVEGQTSGSSLDWAVRSAEAEFAFALELRSDDPESDEDYITDATQICSSAKEALAFHVAAGEFVYGKLGNPEEKAAAAGAEAAPAAGSAAVVAAAAIMQRWMA